MTTRFRLAAFAAALLALAPVTAAAESAFSDAQKKEIGEIVRTYLLENPEILLEVSRELENRQQQAESRKREDALKVNAKALFASEHDFVAGNPDGDVTMVEFFDYNCGWCKKGLPEVMSLLEKDKNLRLVLKEFPIFGGDSDYAAMAAVASKKQGKYWEFHQAMLSHEGKITREAVDEIARAQGLDIEKLKADMNSKEVAQVLADNHKLAEDLAISGTPAFVIDNNLIPGYLPMDGLMAAIGEVRSSGGCKLC
ncbi:DsbA family protein [Aestuariivirga sp.]|uniref:DsbA family protein n=1 Tax=Aestuariivirga sp. TaxID=2650926 RepID=UPI0035936F3D